MEGSGISIGGRVEGSRALKREVNEEPPTKKKKMDQSKSRV